MTTKVTPKFGDKDVELSGTLEEPAMKVLGSTEQNRSILLDLGVIALLLDSVATGGGESLTRLFVLNAQKPEIIPREEDIFLPYVEKIQFEGISNKEQK